MTDIDMPEPLTPAKPYADLLTDREKLDLLEKLGTTDLFQAIDVEHTTTRMGKDDIWRLLAIDAYKQAVKHPLTGELHRDDASVILGLLNQLTDECVAQEYKNRIGHRSREMTDIRSCFARFLEILVKRRHLETLVRG